MLLETSRMIYGIVPIRERGEWMRTLVEIRSLPVSGRGRAA